MAGILTDLTENKRFKEDEIVTIDLGPDYGELPIGPWKKTQVGWEEHYYWTVDESIDEFYVIMSVDDWDSWGECYSDFGNEFGVAKVATRTPVLDVIWNADVKYNRKFGIRW